MTRKMYQWKQDKNGAVSMQRMNDSSQRKIFRLADEDEGLKYAVSSVNCSDFRGYVATRQPKRPS